MDVANTIINSKKKNWLFEKTQYQYDADVNTSRAFYSLLVLLFLTYVLLTVHTIDIDERLNCKQVTLLSAHNDDAKKAKVWLGEQV